MRLLPLLDLRDRFLWRLPRGRRSFLFLEFFNCNLSSLGFRWALFFHRLAPLSRSPLRCWHQWKRWWRRHSFRSCCHRAEEGSLAQIPAGTDPRPHVSEREKLPQVLPASRSSLSGRLGPLAQLLLVPLAPVAIAASRSNDRQIAQRPPPTTLHLLPQVWQSGGHEDLKPKMATEMGIYVIFNPGPECHIHAQHIMYVYIYIHIYTCIHIESYIYIYVYCIILYCIILHYTILYHIKLY